MTPTIKCPHEVPNRSPQFHDFDLGTAYHDGHRIYYCKDCKTVISVQDDRALSILYALADKFGLNE